MSSSSRAAPWILKGPDPRLVGADAEGRYKILLRVEASWEREGDSDTIAGVVPSGGSAGFPMPVLTFFVGPPEAYASAQVVVTPGKLELLRPGTGTQVRAGTPVQFSWASLPGAAIYRLEVRGPPPPCSTPPSDRGGRATRRRPGP
jgi:hypothetical protein